MNNEGQDAFGELSSLVETLTTSGSQSLDQGLFKRVKNICKSSDENVRHLYRMVSSQLEKQHAEIRLSSLQIINEIFSRSHVFRELLTDNFQHFLELTMGTNAEVPLPEPANVAVILKTQSSQAMEKWHEKYGSYYKKLALGYNYLKRVKKFEFDGVRSRSALERLRAQDVETRRTNLTQSKINIVLTEMEETVSEIKNIVTEMDNCFHLVLPRLEEFEVYKEATSCNSNEPDDNQPSTSECTYNEQTTSQVTSAACMSINPFNDPSYKLSITLSALVEIVETKDNKDILNTLREQHKQITSKYLPLVQKWLNILTRHGDNSEKLVDAIDMRNSLTELKQKFEKLKIISKENSSESALSGKYENKEEECEPDEETFLDVPEKGVEYVPEFQRHEYGLEASSSNLPKTCKGHLIFKKLSCVYWLKLPYKNSILIFSDMNTLPISCASNTYHWKPNGHPENSAELADPCSRATALAALVQKQKGNNSKDSKASHCIETKEGEEERSEIDQRQAELLKRAPVVPFDMDLYNWGRPDNEAPSVSDLTSLHCFWSHGADNDDKHCPGDVQESLQSRSIKFTGEFQEVKWACRAPLPGGKLCPRRDRYKCPFHGNIIPRDEMGQPTDDNESLITNDITVKEAAQITREVEFATGMNLGSQKTTGTKRKLAGPGLTDLKKKANTSRSRLEKIVFDKSSLQRVSSEMDKVKKSLVDEKFGNNFNYALRK